MKQFKNFFGLRDQQWSDDGQLIKKKFWTYLEMP